MKVENLKHLFMYVVASYGKKLWFFSLKKCEFKNRIFLFVKNFFHKMTKICHPKKKKKKKKF
jgi:hypothetical protein